MKPRILALLIDRAEAERDNNMLQANATRQLLLASNQTMIRLQSFQADFINRAPGTTTPAMTIDALTGRHQFTVAIDHAIHAQQQACMEREAVNAQAQAQLIERQKRLLALQSLHTRQKSSLQSIQMRREQKETDAWASRSCSDTSQKKTNE